PAPAPHATPAGAGHAAAHEESWRSPYPAPSLLGVQEFASHHSCPNSRYGEGNFSARLAMLFRDRHSRPGRDANGVQHVVPQACVIVVEHHTGLNVALSEADSLDELLLVRIFGHVEHRRVALFPAPGPHLQPPAVRPVPPVDETVPEPKLRLVLQSVTRVHEEPDRAQLLKRRIDSRGYLLPRNLPILATLARRALPHPQNEQRPVMDTARNEGCSVIRLRAVQEQGHLVGGLKDQIVPAHRIP